MRQGELGLQDRDVVAIAGRPVGAGERVRQQAQPFAQQSVDLLGREAIADVLQADRVGAAQNAVVEGFKGNAFACQLALGVFVAVETQFGIERKVGAELEEERAEAAVHRVDVVVVHHRGGAHDPRVRQAGDRALALLGAEHLRLLLGLADEHHAFRPMEFAQVLRHHVVLALALAELDERNPMLRHKAFQPGHEVPAHRAHRRRRRQRLAAVFAEEPDNPELALQPRHVDVEVHPVDALDRKRDMPAENIGDALCYHAPGSGRTVLPPACAGAFRPLSGPIRAWLYQSSS